MLEFDPEKRRTLKVFGGLAAAVGAKMLGISTAHAAQAVDCPIYLFHGVALGGAVVDKVIRDNARLGRKPVSIKTLSEILLGERELPDFPVFSLTFDDGLLSQYEHAKPVLDRFEAEATFFVMGGLMDDTWPGDRVHTYMKPEQIEHLSRLGYEIGSHTVTHRNLVTLYNQGNYGAVFDEINQSKDKLQAVTGSEVTTFCYPSGSNNPGIRQMVSDVYKGGVSTLNVRIQTPNNRYILGRTRA